MSADIFILWGNPTKPETVEVDAFSFVHLEDAEKHVNERRKAGEIRLATIMEALEGNDGKKWYRG